MERGSRTRLAKNDGGYRQPPGANPWCGKRCSGSKPASEGSGQESFAAGGDSKLLQRQSTAHSRRVPSTNHARPAISPEATRSQSPTRDAEQRRGITSEPTCGLCERGPLPYRTMNKTGPSGSGQLKHTRSAWGAQVQQRPSVLRIAAPTASACQDGLHRSRPQAHPVLREDDPNSGAESIVVLVARVRDGHCLSSTCIHDLGGAQSAAQATNCPPQNGPHLARQRASLRL